MFKSLLKFLFNKTGYEQVGVFVGYLRASGWLSSLRTKKAIDAFGNSLPWYSYAAIHFLTERINKLPAENKDNFWVFEFGSGNSTLWWAKNSAFVVSVEDNSDWYKFISKISLTM